MSFSHWCFSLSLSPPSLPLSLTKTNKSIEKNFLEGVLKKVTYYYSLIVLMQNFELLGYRYIGQRCMIHRGSEMLAGLTSREIYHFRGAGTRSLYRSREVEISQAECECICTCLCTAMHECTSIQHVHHLCIGTGCMESGEV